MQLTAPIAPTSISPSPPTRQGGFTLIELLLIIAIIGIMSAILMPGFKGMYNRQALDNSANEIVSAVKQVQNRALSNNQTGYATANTVVLNDCSPSKAYVEKYIFRVVGTNTYQGQRVFKDQSAANVPCYKPTASVDVNLTGLVALPNGVSFASGDYTRPVSYTVVSGGIATLDVSGGSTVRTYYTLTSQHVANLTYYICVTQGRVYAQTSVCW